MRQRARERGADIFFLDEVGVRSDTPLGRSYGLRGKTPVVKTSGQRQQVNAISAVNAKGAFWFKVYTGMLNACLFIVFLKDFLKGRSRPLFLVVDGLPAHKAKTLENYVQSTKGRLELHFLPPYAPDLNPDEFVWGRLKTNGTSKKPLRKNESLKERVTDDLFKIKSDKELVRSFFGAESVSYAIYCSVICTGRLLVIHPRIQGESCASNRMSGFKLAARVCLTPPACLENLESITNPESMIDFIGRDKLNTIQSNRSNDPKNFRTR